MSIATNIVRRQGSGRYYARIGVPLDLQPLLKGKRELWKSLGTSEPQEARRLAAPVLAQWHVEFEELRKRREPAQADLQGAVWEHYRREAEHDRLERMNMPRDEEIGAAKAQLMADVAQGKIGFDPIERVAAVADVLAKAEAPATARQWRQVREQTVRDHLATGETALVEWAADDVIQREGLLIEKGGTAYRDLCQRLQRAELEAVQRASERDRGDWTGRPADEVVKPPVALVSSTFATPGETIMELYDRFHLEKPGAMTADTWDQSRKIVQLFAEFVGETANVSAVNRKNVREWKAALFKLPCKAAGAKVFAGMSFRKVIEANVKIGKPPIVPKTINKYLSALGSFASWLLANDFITEDVMKGMYLDIDKSVRNRRSYTSEELAAIFASPLFKGCRSDDCAYEPGNHQIRDGRFWLPLIGLYTGARLGEIAQLLTDDVRQIHGQWVFHITKEGCGRKSVKTAGSMRVLPVHSELIRLGLINYHEALKAKGERQFFPEIQPDTRGYFSGEPSRFYNRYVRKIGVKNDVFVNFHSYRHTIADAFRRAGYLNEQFDMMLGHTKASTTGRYGIMAEGPLLQRVKMIESVSFPDLDLSHLYP